MNELLSAPANIIQILGGVAAVGGALVAWRNYLRNPKRVHSESIFLCGEGEPGFINAGTREVGEMFKELLDRMVIMRAVRKTTPAFPQLFIDPARHPSIADKLRDDLSSVDADTSISALGYGKSARAYIRDWHMIVIARLRCREGEQPLIKRDFFSFTNLVEMLENPLKAMPQFKGVERRHFMHHLEEAGLVAYTQPEVLRRAIREAYPERAEKNPANTAWVEAHAAKLLENGRSLVRFLLLATDKSLVALDEAERHKSFDMLRQLATDEQVNEIIAKRMKASVWERVVDAVIYRAKLGFQWRAEGRDPPHEIGLFNFFSVSHMTCVTTRGPAAS